MPRDLSHRLIQAQDEERRQLARELHDHVSQQLALVAIDLQQLAAQPPASAEALVSGLQEAWRRTVEAASAVHAISHRLHPSKLQALGLVPTISAYCRDVLQEGVSVRFDHRDVPAGISPECALSVFRVLEEALSNVVRHSGAASAEVTLAYDAGALVLSVRDDGCGFVADQSGGGIGLASMRARVQALDGTVSVISEPGRGALVEARLPLSDG